MKVTQTYIKIRNIKFFLISFIAKNKKLLSFFNLKINFCHKTLQERAQKNPDKQDSNGSGSGRRPGDAGVHTLCRLRVHNSAPESAVSLRLGRLCSLPHALQPADAHYKHCPDPHISYMAVHSRKVCKTCFTFYK